MRYTGPKNKIARKFGIDLGLKSQKASAKLARRLNIPPGQHGPKGRRRITQYGEQLSEKQKMKYIYGVSEKQLRNYYEKAAKVKGATGEQLISLLERRLDNTVYRLGLAPTRASGRQLVSHGHVMVNGKKVDIPSYSTRPGEVITLTAKGMQVPAVIESMKNEASKMPSWLERVAAAGKIISQVKRDEIGSDISEQLIVEYYSR